MARELNVWFFGKCVGVLTQDEGYLSFRYLPEWLGTKIVTKSSFLLWLAHPKSWDFKITFVLCWLGGFSIPYESHPQDLQLTLISKYHLIF